MPPDRMSSVGEEKTSEHKSILLRLQTKADVFKKYEVVENLVASGSIGAVSKVKIKEGKIGGSAVKHKTNGISGFLKKLSFAKQDEVRLFPSQDYTYALKSIIVDRVSPVFLDELKNEINILRCMDHPNIVKAHEVYYVKNKQIYIVMDYCHGGDLYTRSPYSEKEAANIVTQLCSAVRYMHEHKIVHRDLKFENVMFESKAKDSQIKVLDFGLSKKFLGELSIMTDRVGTIYTMAPQVLQGVYSSQADLWSVGVIAYMLLSSQKPFVSRNRRRMIDLIMRGAAIFNSPVWLGISDDAKDFVSNLLVVDPKKRMNAAGAMNHTWLVNREQLSDALATEEVLAAIEDSLVNYQQTSQLKKLALITIAYRSTSADIVHLRDVFSSMDTKRNGILDFEEFKAALCQSESYTDEEIEEIFRSIDLNKSGHINYTEFLAATIETRLYIEEDRIAEAFDRIDSDETGFISRENLIDALGTDCPPEEVDAIMEAADKNKDGKISFTEFLQVFREQRKAMFDAAEDGESLSNGETNLVGLDAKIPGGRFDADLDPHLRKEIS